MEKQIELLKLPANKLASLVREHKIKSEELIELSLFQIEKLNPKINAVISVFEEQALKQARKLKDHGQPFLGVPLLIKGLGQQLKGMPDTNANKMLKDSKANYTANLIKKAQNAGFIIIGQTNFPEFGLKNITDSELYGKARNPWNLNRNAGGSSGGSAASVASGMVPLALGNDGGGSIRIPAAWNGLIGLKPTRGRITTGPKNWRSWQGASVNFGLTTNVLDTAKLLDVMQDVQTAAVFQCPLFSEGFERAYKHIKENIKIGYILNSPVQTEVSHEAKKAVLSAVKFLQENGFQVEEIKWPTNGKDLMKSYYIMNEAELAASFVSMEKQRNITQRDMELLSWAIYQTGKNITATQYSLALQKWDEAGYLWAKLHEDYPLVLSPTNADVAPLNSTKQTTSFFEDKMKKITKLPPSAQQELIYDQWLNALSLTPFTQQANLTGEPAISLPTYITEEGLPLGIQFQAAKGREDLLLQIAYLFEKNHMFTPNK